MPAPTKHSTLLINSELIDILNNLGSTESLYVDSPYYRSSEFAWRDELTSPLFCDGSVEVGIGSAGATGLVDFNADNTIEMITVTPTDATLFNAYLTLGSTGALVGKTVCLRCRSYSGVIGSTAFSGLKIYSGYDGNVVNGSQTVFNHSSAAVYDGKTIGIFIFCPDGNWRCISRT